MSPCLDKCLRYASLQLKPLEFHDRMLTLLCDEFVALPLLDVSLEGD